MATQQEIEQKAQQQYKTASAATKKTLEVIFGKDLFIIPITDRIKNFSDICREAGVNEKDYAIPAKGTYKQKAEKCMERLMLLEKVLNGGVIINQADIKSARWEPYFNTVPDKKQPAGFGLSFDVCYYDGSDALLGVRPQYISKPIAEFAGKTFLADYTAFAQNYQLSKTHK